MFHWFDETLKTISVTTIHPLGWTVRRLKKRFLREESPPPRTVASVGELARERTCPVLCVHGIFHNSTAFWRMERKLQKRGFHIVRTIELWTSVDSLDAMILQLQCEVERLLEVHRRLERPGKIRIVAHSLGGMVTRAALLDPEFAKLVDKVLFLGTPHQGSLSYRLPFPRSLRAFAPKGPIMKRLRSEPLPAGVQYWNLRGGALDLVTPRQSTFLPHVHDHMFEQVGHAGLLNDTQVIQTVISILETPLERPEERDQS